MRYSILFAIALILISGFVAYFGDLLGRRMGKKRLTLFNLRPRHTAIIVTTITGMVISALALFTLISAHSGFRKVFTQGERILARNEKLQADNAALVANRKRLEAEVETRRQEVVRARAEREKAVAAVERLEKDKVVKARELAELKKRTDATERQLRAKTAELRRAQSDLNEAQEDFAIAARKAGEAEAKLKTTETKLKDVQTKLSEAEAQYGKFMLQTWTARESEVILNLDDEVIRGKISPSQTDSGIRQDLVRLLDQAGARALELGAVRGENGRAVAVVSHIYSKAPGQEAIIVLTDERVLIDSAIETIRKSPMDVVVQVVGGVNSVKGEQAQVELRFWVNKRVYRGEEIIAAITIDGGLSEGRILLRLSDFWKQDVSWAAVKHGIIPASGPKTTGAAGRDPEAQVDQLLNVLDQIKAVNGPTRIAVYATTDIYAADLLDVSNIRFAVMKAE